MILKNILLISIMTLFLYTSVNARNGDTRASILSMAIKSKYCLRPTPCPPECNVVCPFEVCLEQPGCTQECCLSECSPNPQPIQ